MEEVRHVLKKELRLHFRRVRRVPIQANSERCLVLRQSYSLEMLKLLAGKKRVLNVDESLISETEYGRRMWCPSTAPATVTERAVSTRLALIAALDTDGAVYFSLTTANTDWRVMRCFLGYLSRRLDGEDASWRESTVVLLD
ncbi:MAG: hypothetical protein VX554_00120, partial [Candidatus Thermoplasmatota archaeon]|nr:hypothetical protein [Candidatus Thermoplasmatota archaeon]